MSLFSGRILQTPPADLDAKWKLLQSEYAKDRELDETSHLI